MTNGGPVFVYVKGGKIVRMTPNRSSIRLKSTTGEFRSQETGLRLCLKKKCPGL